MLSTDLLLEATGNLSETYRNKEITREEYQNLTADLEKSWQVWLAFEYNLSHLSLEIIDAAYQKAWQYGHSAGYSEVENFYRDLADILVLCETSNINRSK